MLVSQGPKPCVKAKEQLPVRKRGASLITRATLEGKRIAVVGASRGIGLEVRPDLNRSRPLTKFAKQLLEKDNYVYATARSLAKAKELEELRRQSKRLSLSEVDTTDVNTIQAWVDSLKSDGQLDAIFTVAGAASWKDLDHVDSDELIGLFTVNAVGPLLVVQRLLRAKLLKKGSIIVNLTSKMGSMGDNTSGGTYAYRASKAAINAITKSLAIDLEDQGITACVLHPGWVRTDMTSGSGLINVDECVRGLISVVETEPSLSGRLFDYKHEEIPW